MESRFGTRMTLSDRFALIRKEAQKRVNSVPQHSMININPYILESHAGVTLGSPFASERNRTLVDKLARDTAFETNLLRRPLSNTPTPTQLALNRQPIYQKTYQQTRPQTRVQQPPKERVSVKARLGSASKNIKNRLGEVRKPIGQRIGRRVVQPVSEPPSRNGVSRMNTKVNFKAKRTPMRPAQKGKQVKSSKLTQQDLDADIDSYMRNSRMGLNADLEAYMSTR